MNYNIGLAIIVTHTDTGPYIILFRRDREDMV